MQAKSKSTSGCLHLLKNKININSFALENTVGNLSRTEADSLFNFNFLLTAFSDTASQKAVEPEKSSKWVISIDKVRFKNVPFSF
jgi:hypothetical protein